MSELRSSCRPPEGGDDGAMVILRAGCREGKICSALRNLLSPSIHSLVRQPISNLIVLAQRVADFEVLEPPDQLLRLLIQLAKFGMTHLVDTFHLADHQFGIADHLERSDLIFGGVAESGEESLIFGVVGGVVAKVFAEFGDWMSGRVVDSNTIAGRPRIAAGSPIDVGGVGSGRGFRCGEKIAGIGRRRRHGWSLQRGRASSENHRYLWTRALQESARMYSTP